MFGDINIKNFSSVVHIKHGNGAVYCHGIDSYYFPVI